MTHWVHNDSECVSSQWKITSMHLFLWLMATNVGGGRHNVVTFDCSVYHNSMSGGPAPWVYLTEADSQTQIR